MGRLGLGSGLAIAALTISGCGSVANPGGTPAVTASTPGLASSAAPGRAHGGGPQSVESPGGGSQPAPPSPVFPLTISRTGGIAEFNDTITLRSDGRVNVETRSVHDRTCTLDRQRQRDLIAALGTLHLGDAADTPVPDPAAVGSGSTAGTDGIGGANDTNGADSTGGTPAGSDTSQIRISVIDARGRSVDLGEPSLASVLTMVTTLVSDVTLSQPSTPCVTSTAADAGR